MDEYLLLLILIIIVAGIVINLILARKRKRQKMLSEFARIPVRTGFVKESAGAYHLAVKTQKTRQSFIDDLTWDDLDIDDVFVRMNCCYSSVGEEYLYHLLHTQCFDEQALQRREELIEAVVQDEQFRLKLQLIF